LLNHVLPFNYQKVYMQEESISPEKSVKPVDQVEKQSIITNKSLHKLEKESIIQALIDNRGIQTKAAAELGMTARQIGYKIKKYGIEL